MDWCLTCEKQILPKRVLVPVAPITSPSPQNTTPQPNSPMKRSKNGTIRARAGLVQGTGRVRPNGTLKRTDSKTNAPLAAAPPPAAVKQRMVIDQSPSPLYCSDECRLADIRASHATYDVDPARNSPRLPPVPHNSFSRDYSESASDSAASSVESVSSLSTTPPSPSTIAPKPKPAKVSPSMATLAKMYDFPPFPPPAPVFEEPSSSSDSDVPEYNSGIMMAGRRLAALCPVKPAAKRSPFGYAQVDPPKIVRGWNDGSNDWRADLYSFATPSIGSTTSTAHDSRAAYRSFVASPHHGSVHSTLAEAAHNSSERERVVPAASSLPADTAALVNQFSLSFSRRSDSRTSLHGAAKSPPSAFVPSTSPNRRERSHLAPGVEGKLLVPDVMLRKGGSSASIRSAGSAHSYPSPYTGAHSRANVRSPLTMNTDLSDDSASTNSNAIPAPKRPNIETRSWSYDNVPTYPMMAMSPPKVKQRHIQVVDGVEQAVEVEVTPPLKRLFLFPGKSSGLEPRESSNERFERLGWEAMQRDRQPKEDWEDAQ